MPGNGDFMSNLSRSRNEGGPFSVNYPTGSNARPPGPSRGPADQPPPQASPGRPLSGAQEAAQVLRQGQGAAVTPPGILLQALQTDGFQPPRDLGLEAGGGLGGLRPDLVQQF